MTARPAENFLEFLSWVGFLFTLCLLTGGIVGLVFKAVERIVHGPRRRT